MACWLYISLVLVKILLLVRFPKVCCGTFGYFHSGSSGTPMYTTTLFGPPDREPSSTPLPQTVFTRKNNTELRGQVGSTVVLHCPAEHVGESTVSWIRRRDYHLLTVGNTIYSSDQRFQVRCHKNEKNMMQDWQLHIRYVQKHDEGVYECQVSSHPPISLMTMLHVVEATSEILGGPEKFLRTGSSLRLVCVLKKTTQPPSYVFWYLNQKMINYDDKVKVETSGDLSVLFLNNLGPESSGNYSCVPSNAKKSRIHIQVLRGGEIPAAIQSGIKEVYPSAQLILLVLLASSALPCFLWSYTCCFVHLTYFAYLFARASLGRACAQLRNQSVALSFVLRAQSKSCKEFLQLPYRFSLWKPENSDLACACMRVK